MFLRFSILHSDILSHDSIMKKVFTLLFIVCCSFSVIGQKKSGIHLEDNLTHTFFENIPKGLSDDSLAAFILKNRRKMESQMPDKFAESFFDNMAFDNNKKYTLDSIPDVANVIINGIVFQDKGVLKKVDNFSITTIRKDSLNSLVLIKADSIGLSERKVIERKYRKPYARVTQEHPILAHDFFLFKINTLEPVRYRSSSYSPVLDVFNTADSIGNIAKPRVMIDGRLQAKSFDYDKINLNDIEKIDVFDGNNATKYFGQKAKSGLISYITKGSTFCLDWTVANTHVVGEIQDNKGNWKPIVDTLFSNIEQFNDYRKKCLKTNGAIYIINGKPETEESNRKTIDMDAITNFRVINSAKTKRVPLSVSNKLVSISTETTKGENDTIFIETSRNTWALTSNFSKVFSELKRLRKTTLDPIPLYFVDNQEIDAEKLKQYKPKELEFVESLEGCDAISKYGKRAEYGVVIYRKKKIE
jgi:hypothetical protein